jgi:hypothetical protein
MSSSSTSEPLYISRSFGFQVALPPGLTYGKTAPPNPDHGFNVLLESNSMLWVDASYTDAGSTGREASVRARGCIVRSLERVHLAERPALKEYFSCPANIYGTGYEEVLMVAVVRSKDRSPVAYQVGMRASNDDVLVQNKALFEEVVKGFRFEK